MTKKNSLLMLLFMVGCNAFANEPILRIESTITGNQEQPKVFSILPWQDMKAPDHIGDEMRFEQNEDVYKPINRENFNLEVQYIDATRMK